MLYLIMEVAWIVWLIVCKNKGYSSELFTLGAIMLGCTMIAEEIATTRSKIEDFLKFFLRGLR